MEIRYSKKGVRLMKLRYRVSSVFGVILFFSILLIDLTILTNESISDGHNISFRWAFGALTGPQDDRKFVPITKDTVLYSGDQFKMMIELQSECYVYVIFKGSKEEILLLFPDQLYLTEKTLKINQEIFLPNKELWFALDDQAGIEKIFLLASTTPLVKLEELIKKYESSVPEIRPGITEEIQKFIENSRKQYKQLTAVAEKPIQIGGTFRNVKKSEFSHLDISAFAIEITEDDFFGRTFTIEHR